MAMAVITRKQEVCDVCKDLERTSRRYRIGEIGEVRTVALCDEHAQPINELLRQLRRLVPRVGAGRTSNRVTSLDQLEEIKRARKSTQPKKQGR